MDCEVLENLVKMTSLYTTFTMSCQFISELQILMHMNCIIPEWWKMYGAHTPHLQNLTIKIHLKKRNRLEHQKLQELIYIVRELGGDGEDVEDEMVFDDVLTGRNVANATETAKPLKYTRKQTQIQRANLQ
ncbi:hypothetical protein CR513_03138, partial [Mucuna pruriens]